jgi:hypothetical protein
MYVYSSSMCPLQRSSRENEPYPALEAQEDDQDEIRQLAIWLLPEEEPETATIMC